MDLTLELRQQRCSLIDGLVLHLYFADQLAELTLEGQRSAAGFLASAHCMAVITDPFRQEKKCVRMFNRKPLRSSPIAGEITACQSRQQVRGSGGESVGEAQM